MDKDIEAALKKFAKDCAKLAVQDMLPVMAAEIAERIPTQIDDALISQALPELQKELVEQIDAM